MKLATYRDGSRDGHLVVVSRDLTRALFVNTQGTRLQQVLDDWNFHAPLLQELALTLDHGKARHAFPFDPAQCLAPLPRTGHWTWQPLGAETLPRHDARPGSTAGDAMDDADEADEPAAESDATPSTATPPPARRGRRTAPRPSLRTGAGDDMLGPRAPLPLPADAVLGTVDAGLAVVTGELAAGAGPSQALEAVRLLGLYARAGASVATDDTWPAPEGGLATAWSPVLVTPDELGPAWVLGRLGLALDLNWPASAGPGGRGRQRVEGGAQRWHFGQLLAWAARQRRLRAGTVLGCDWLGATVAEDLAGAVPVAVGAAPARIEMSGSDGLPVFGSLLIGAPAATTPAADD